MLIPANLSENLQFLIAEICTQALTLRSGIDRQDPARMRRILDRAGYVANLKQRVQMASLQLAATPDNSDTLRLQGATLGDIAHQLERISDKFRDVCRQFLETHEPQALALSGFKAPLARLRESLEGLGNELPPTHGDRAMMLAVCAQRFDKQACKAHDSFVDELRTHKKHAGDLTRGVLMAHAFRQTGETLARLSEALLTLQLGQPMSFDRYQSLQAMIDQQPSLAHTAVSPLAQTRSGSAVAGLTRATEKTPAAVFKDGLRQKLRDERRGVESWHELYPGLAPKILAYKKRGESAALLIEHLPGLTFEHILLRETETLLQAGSTALFRTLQDVWQATQSKTPVAARFMAQLEKRLPDVEALHGALFAQNARIGRYRQTSFTRLVKRASKIERRLTPSFSVYIHGDFNVDNIIYDPQAERVHFIDLHRSRYMDYLQDVSVFMVSCLRLPVRTEAVRHRIQTVILAMDTAARQFARERGDHHYDARLALGLARSLFTSTRFMADQSVAADFIVRARWLLERVIDLSPEQASDFALPMEELFRGFDK